MNLGATHKCQHWKKPVINCLWVGGFEGQLFKKSVDFENWKLIILKDKPPETLFEVNVVVFSFFWAILEELQIK